MVRSGIVWQGMVQRGVVRYGLVIPFSKRLNRS